jgi:hypothetical protein
LVIFVVTTKKHIVTRNMPSSEVNDLQSYNTLLEPGPYVAGDQHGLARKPFFGCNWTASLKLRNSDAPKMMIYS